ncbi:ABC transporter permease [Candidatus Bipolaricaulota bacterium]
MVNQTNSGEKPSEVAETSELPIRKQSQSPGWRSFKRFARYTAVRVFTLFCTMAVGIYLVIMIANMGGYVDKIIIGTIREEVGSQAAGNETVLRMAREDRQAWIADKVNAQIHARGLDQPFLIRSFQHLYGALTLDLGRSQFISSDSGSKEVSRILLERLPITMVLFTSGSLIVFFLALAGGLFLSRRYGSAIDRVVVGLAPTSTAPAWFYGLFLILIFASILKILPFGGMLGSSIPETPLMYALTVMKHMILPLSAWIISRIFLVMYTWRTFFLIHSEEDYVELAKAKGLRGKSLERRYILRPTLPAVITAFTFILITSWQGAIITETVFGWPGLGSLYNTAIASFDTPVIVGITVIFAYLLAFTVFFLDIVYAFIDPRVKLGKEGAQ